MNQEIFYQIALYVGYFTLVSLCIAIAIFVWWVIIFYLLRIKRIRNGIFRMILSIEIKSMNDNEYASLINEIKRARY